MPRYAVRAAVRYEVQDPATDSMALRAVLENAFDDSIVEGADADPQDPSYDLYRIVAWTRADDEEDAEVWIAATLEINDILQDFSIISVERAD